MTLWKTKLGVDVTHNAKQKCRDSLEDYPPKLQCRLTHNYISFQKRKDGSGTTLAFTQILDTVDSWEGGSFKNRSGWRPGVIHYYGQTTPGMTGIILSFEHSIGYLSIADAKTASKLPDALFWKLEIKA